VEPNLNNISNKENGWNWLSFILGPFWYIINGLITKGIVLLIISLITFGLGIPIIWLYCGLRGNSDFYEKNLKNRSKFDPNKI
jgi:hypothetical protein